MKKRFVGSGFLLLVALFLLPLAGCGGQKVPPVGEVTPLPTVTSSPSVSVNQSPTVTFFPDGITNITYYTLSEELELVEVTSLMTGDGAMTPKELVDYVTATMEDVSVTVKVLDVMTSDESIIVDFDEGSVPVRYANTRLESAILDALAQSLLDNFTEYNSVIFRAGGQAYQSENRTFDLNYIYMGR